MSGTTNYPGMVPFVNSGFRLFGIPVKVGGDALVISLLIMANAYSTTRSIGPILLFAAAVVPVVVVHELGHALESRRAGGRPEITIGLLGGQTTGLPIHATLWRRAWIASAGIAYSLVFLGLVHLFNTFSGIQTESSLGEWLRLLVMINAWWALIQLLPFGAFDGAAILEYSLAALGVPHSLEILLVTNVVFGVAVTAWLVSQDQMFLAIYAVYLAWMGVSQRMRILRYLRSQGQGS